MRDLLVRARVLLSGARSLLVLTGAGVSAESGVPTFRGPGGLWETHRPEDLATPRAFTRDPRLVWEWYGWRREVVSACRPNPAHRAIARRALAGGAHVVTQNVDGLHETAAREEAGAEDPGRGLPLELHGSLFRVRCTGCGRRSADRGRIDASSEETLPRCERCGALLRPDVVWFGEGLEPEVLGRAFDLARQADACLVVGTSGLVHPAASLPLTASGAGAPVVEVNLDPTPLSRTAAVSIRAPAGEVLPELLSAR